MSFTNHWSYRLSFPALSTPQDQSENIQSPLPVNGYLWDSGFNRCPIHSFREWWLTYRGWVPNLFVVTNFRTILSQVDVLSHEAYRYELRLHGICDLHFLMLTMHTLSPTAWASSSTSHFFLGELVHWHTWFSWWLVFPSFDSMYIW
jgi:hypothetical protein